MKYLSLILLLSLSASIASADNTNNFKWIKEIRYEQVRPYCDGLSAFKQNNKWGYMDVDGKVTIEPKYDDCKDFSNGFAAVKKNDKWGYINAEGKMMIEPSFEDCTSFKKGLATAKRANKWGVIDKRGTSVAGFIFDKIGEFSDGMALANNGALWYYIMSDGKAQKLKSGYKFGEFSNGLAPYREKRNGKWGYINTKGKNVIDAVYDTVGTFNYGIAHVVKKGQHMFISTKDKKKKMNVPIQDFKFVNGFAKVKAANGIRFINEKYEYLPLIAKDATDFNEEGIAVLMLDDGSVQYVNTAGQILINGKYERAGNFKNGLAWVSNNGKFGYIDLKGNIVIDTLFNSATDFSEGIAFVSSNGRIGSIKYQKDAVMPELEFSSIDLVDKNANKKVEAEENFKFAVHITNPSNEELKDIEIQFANNVNQSDWFEFKDKMINIPSLKAHADTIINFEGKAKVSLLSEDIDVIFRGCASNMYTIQETDWKFEAMGINACKPVIKSYWVYKDNHTALENGDKVNIRLTIKNEGKDLAKNVKVDFQYPDGIYGPDQGLVIPLMKPGETKTISSVFTMDSVVVDDLTIVAKISDFTKQHDKIEYLQFSAGKMNPEVSLENGGVMRFMYGNEYQNFNTSNNNLNATQVLASNETISQEIGTVSELLEDIEVVAKPDYNKFALIIGNEDYNIYKQTASYEVNVDYAVSDAEAFAEYAKDYMGVPKENITLLKNATSTQMKLNINTITEMCKADPGMIELYVFYAGHGQVDAESHDTYLIPTDVSLMTPKYGYKLQDLYATLGSCNAKRTMVFMDACYSGVGRGIVMNVNKAPVNGNMVVFTATSSQERSMPYREKKHGMFTYFLLKTIKDAGGKLTVQDLYNSVKRTVGRNSTYINKQKQTPELIGGEGIEAGWENWTLD